MTTPTMTICESCFDTAKKLIERMKPLFPIANIPEDMLDVMVDINYVDVEIVMEGVKWTNKLFNEFWLPAKRVRNHQSEEMWQRKIDFGWTEKEEFKRWNKVSKALRVEVTQNRPQLFLKGVMKKHVNIKKQAEKTAMRLKKGSNKSKKANKPTRNVQDADNPDATAS